MFRNCFRLSPSILLILLVAIGCGGGSKGTGGQGFDGTVVSRQSQPLSGVAVTLLESGDSDVTDSDGRFDIYTEPLSGAVNVDVDTGTFRGQVLIGEVSTRTKNLTVRIQIDETLKTATSEEVAREEEGHDDPDSHTTPTPRPTRTPRPTASPNGNTATPSPTPAAPATPTSTPTSTPSTETPTVSPTPGDHDGHDDEHESPTPEGEDVEAEGRIQSLSSNSIEVENTEFTVDSETRITRGDHESIDFSSLELNQRAHVKGKRRSGVNYATSIKIEDSEHE